MVDLTLLLRGKMKFKKASIDVFGCCNLHASEWMNKEVRSDVHSIGV